jgi:RND family efflux transporter MFP subunit
MKRSLYILFAFFLLAGSFLAGSWYSQRDTAKKNNRPAGIPLAVSAETKAEPESETLSSLPPGTVKISREKQQVIGVKVGTVEKAPWTHTLRVLGRVAPDENRIFKVKAPVDGIILEVYPSTTGSMVKKGQNLASYYSPDIYTAVQSYLLAMSTDRYRRTLQAQVTESRLKYLGMTASQIEEIKKIGPQQVSGQIDETIVLRAPATGFVLSREVSPELRFLKGEELYRIAELDRVWVYADIYENEARYFRPGVSAKLSHPQLGKEYPARVSDVLPLFDATTRTLKVRLEVDNPGFALRPDMFVDVELPVKLPSAISIPAEAILDSGLQKTVFVELGNGFFEPREVETGWRIGNRVEIIKGLKPGERIVISGNFLIDSESKLEMAAAGMVGTLSKDPVCGLEVSAKKASKENRATHYNGKTYYFCSEECKREFEKNPNRFIQKNSEETSMEKTPSPKFSPSSALKEGAKVK